MLSFSGVNDDACDVTAARTLLGGGEIKILSRTGESTMKILCPDPRLTDDRPSLTRRRKACRERQLRFTLAQFRTSEHFLYDL
mgnify:CR=1 FL=1